MVSEKPPVYEKALWALFSLTLISLALEPWLFNTSLIIKPDSDYSYGIFSDQDVGGASTVSWVNEEKKEWKCTIAEGIAYPYCNYQLYLTDSLENGVDLTRFDTISIWISYRGQAETIRVFIRNSNPAYTRANDHETTKFHQLEVAPEIFAVPVELKLSSFNVADWWIRNHNIPLELAQRELDNVISIDISSGTNIGPGAHYFKFHHVILTGRMLTTEQWYLLLIIFWLFVIFVFLVYQMVTRRVSIRERVQREAEFKEINTLLDNRVSEIDAMVQANPATATMHRQEVELALCEALSAREQKGVPLSIVLMDVDHFLSIDEQTGSEAANRALIGISVLVKSNIREGEQFLRWGADEFVLVCSGASNETARIIAEKIRRLVDGHDFGIGQRITASFGVAGLMDGETLAELFKRADVALYAAKAVGRNRVCISGENGPSSIE